MKKELVDCGCEEKRKDPSQFAQALLASLVTSGIAARKKLESLQKNGNDGNTFNAKEKVVKVLCDSSPGPYEWGARIGMLGVFINNPVYNLLVKLQCVVRPSSSNNNNVATQERDKDLFKRSLPDDLLDNLPFVDDSEDEDVADADDSLQCLALDDPCDEIDLEDCLARSNDYIEVEDLRTATPTESSMVWCMVCQRILQGHPTRDDEDVLSHLAETTTNKVTKEDEQIHAFASAAFLYIQNNSDYRIAQQPYADNFWRQAGYGPDPNDRCDSPEPEKEPAGWGTPPREEQLDWDAEIPEVFLPDIDFNNNDLGPDDQGGAGAAPQDMFEIGYWGNPVNLRKVVKKNVGKSSGKSQTSHPV